MTNPDSTINEEAIPIETQEDLKVFNATNPRPNYALTETNAILDSLKKMQGIGSENLPVRADND